MHRFVAARTPAGAPGNEGPVLNPADQEAACGGLLLKMAFEAKGLIPLGEELVID